MQVPVRVRKVIFSLRHMSTKSYSVQFENGNPLAKLPVDIQLRGRQVFSSVLKYAYELLTLDTMMKVEFPYSTYFRIENNKDQFNFGTCRLSKYT